MDVRVRFPHGVGDCVYFAHALPLYVRRGHQVTVSCAPDKRILFEPCGVEVVHDDPGYPEVHWDESAPVGQLTGQNYAVCNKAASNFRRPPMPDIGDPQSLWQEFADVRLDIAPFIPAPSWDAARRFLADLPRPVVLLHTVGNAFQDTKSLPPDLTLGLYRELLDTTEGTVVLLDWDNRVPRLASYRLRHLLDDWEWITVPTLMALIHEADLLIGIDSGPFHAARFTDTPSMGVFPHPYHYPARVTLPRARQLCLVPRTQTIEWNQKARGAYNIVHCDGETVTPEFIAANAAAMLKGPRYLDDAHLAADVQMQQFVFDFERGYGRELSAFVDRQHSYDRVLRMMRERFRDPTIVETGCIRAPEDWRGAGFSTYLFAAYVHRVGGELSSIDLSPENCRFAQQATAEFTRVTVNCGDSVEFLQGFGRRIDVLLLDSMDTEVPGHADHAVREFEAARPFCTTSQS